MKGALLTATRESLWRSNEEPGQPEINKEKFVYMCVLSCSVVAQQAPLSIKFKIVQKKIVVEQKVSVWEGLWEVFSNKYQREETPLELFS